MLLELGIVFTGYALVRFFEKKREAEKKDAEEINIEQANLALAEAEEAEKKEHKHYLKMSGVAVGIGAVRQFLLRSPSFALLNCAAFTYIAVPHFKSAENSLLNERKIDGYVLYFLADTTTFLLGQYFAAALGVSLFHLSKLVVSRARGHSKKKLLDIFGQQQPQNAWLLKDGIEIEVPVSTVRNGDIIVIKSGDIIPVDGIVTDGIASIDEHALTGESRPLEKVAGDEVFAATVVITGKICIRIEKSGQETTIAKINRILNRSADIKTNFQLKGEKWADKGVLPMLIIAGLGLPVLGPVGFVIILSSHVCTKIRVVAPLSTLNYISVATHNGVMIKDGRALERLSKVDVVLFDKTGTLTYQDNEVVRIIAVGPYHEDDILTYAAAAEHYVAHPIAKAILRKAEETDCTIPLVTDESEYQIGYGITVNLEAEEKVVRVGSSRFMLSEGISIPDEIKAAEEQAHLEGHSFVIVAVNHQAGGAIELQTMLRPEVRDVLKKLRQTGVKHLAIVSGDHELPTRKLAESLGMDSYYHDITPERKADMVEELQKSGKTVCFVGDGINDAIAMRKSDVSISINGATSIATDVAEVILMDGTLSHLSDIFEVAKNLDSNLKNSLILSIVPGVIKIGGFLLLNFGIVTAIIVDAIFTLAGVGNSMLPLLDIEEGNEEKKVTDEELAEKPLSVSGIIIG